MYVSMWQEGLCCAINHNELGKTHRKAKTQRGAVRLKGGWNTKLGLARDSRARRGDSTFIRPGRFNLAWIIQAAKSPLVRPCNLFPVFLFHYSPTLLCKVTPQLRTHPITHTERGEVRLFADKMLADDYMPLQEVVISDYRGRPC